MAGETNELAELRAAIQARAATRRQLDLDDQRVLAAILAARQAGLTLRAIGAAAGLSHERIRQMLEKAG